MNSSSKALKDLMQRRNVVSKLLSNRGEMFVVSGLGASSWDVAACGDNELNFTLWGGMGGAVMVGLGMALSQPERRVLVITGDGEMLMGMGSLATVAVQSPPNLSVAVLDNERYGETGMQHTHTAYDVNIDSVAGAAGIRSSAKIVSETELDAAIDLIATTPGPHFFAIKVAADAPPLVLPPRDGKLLAKRFRQKANG